MKKYLKKIKKPHLKRKQSKEAIPSGALPRITNDTVAEHREEVLSSARKYIYPLQHSKHKIVILTVSIVLISVVAFFTYCTLALYRFQGTSTFLYKATQVIPFPIARQGNRFIAYENYLFELRRDRFFYENKQQVDYDSNFGKQQLEEQKRRAFNTVVDNAYIKQLAKQNNVKVSDREVEDQIVLLQNLNRIGNGRDVLDDVLRQYYGWTREDFMRRLHMELLRNKVLEKLDVDAKGRADDVLAQIKAGGNFADLAKQNSDDIVTKEAGGEINFLIEKSNRELPPQVIDAIFKLQPGQTTDTILTGTGLEIYKLLELQDGKAKIARIAINFKDINEFIDDLKEKQPTKPYITVPEVSNEEPIQQ
jgi:hypothetical protein